MKKIEIIWGEILFQAIEKREHQFTQKDLAHQLQVSTSTIFQALKVPRRMGALRVTGRFFTVSDAEKLLYHWASVRDLNRDISFRGHVDLPILEIEGLIPPEAIFGAYSAARKILGEAPADYDCVYIYLKNVDQLKKRFKFSKGRTNVIVLAQDPLMVRYGKVTSIAQTFVDLWNVSDWQAKDFTLALKEKIDGLLS